MLNNDSTGQTFKKRVVFTIGGKGGVGKTGVTLAIADWYQSRQIPFLPLDLDTENKAHRSIVQSNTQLEDRLLDLPSEIQAGIGESGDGERDSGLARKVFGIAPQRRSPSARNRVRDQPGMPFGLIRNSVRLRRNAHGINADAITAKIAESIRQSFIQTELASVAQELHLHVGTITDAARQLAAMAAGLDDSHAGLVARVQHAVTAMLANLDNAAAHIRTVSKDLMASGEENEP